MEGNAVVVGRVNHQAQRACLATHAEGLEVLLQHLAIGDAGGRTVFAADGSSIGEIMLQTSRNIIHPDMVRVVPLKASCHLGSHDAIEQNVFAEAFPHTRPKWTECHVHHGRIHPGDETGTALVGCYLADATGNGCIEAGTLPHFLREERCAPCVAGTVYLVHAIEFGHATLGHRSIVEGANHLSPLRWCLCHAKGDVQNGAYAVPSKHLIDSLCREHTASKGA